MDGTSDSGEFLVLEKLMSMLLCTGKGQKSLNLFVVRLVHLSFLLFLHRLAEEARTNAFENKSKIIKPEHVIAAAKVILKKSRG
ncbi:PREDICTED: centromere protein W [Eurypyga helias]|uniref:centromere protein W n=1 Tax=Eurypyga helias TaxID=54383 RepID=UPI000528A423|nr:PREDICTED: centromere protein W [Eurypyga helias]